MKTTSVIALLALPVLLSACATRAPSDTPITLEGEDRTYYQLNERRFDRFVVKDREVFGRYDKIMLFPIQLDGMLILRSGDPAINRSWTGVTYEDMLPYVDSFDELARHYFTEAKGFELTNTGGENVLAVEFRLKSYLPQSSRVGALGVDTVGDLTVTSFGEMRMQVVLADSQSGELIAVLEDGMAITPRNFGVSAFGNTTTVDASARNTRGNQRAAWRRAFRKWLGRFRSDLTDLREAALAAEQKEA